MVFILNGSSGEERLEEWFGKARLGEKTDASTQDIGFLD
jgi:hypothetical protein